MKLKKHVFSGDDLFTTTTAFAYAADSRRAVQDNFGTKKADNLRGTENDDGMLAYGGNDKVNGKAGDDAIQGGGGNDILIGGAGDDAIWGNKGNDTLNGEDGVNFLYGGDGDDVFIFNGTFNTAMGDKGRDTFDLRADGDIVGFTQEDVLVIDGTTVTYDEIGDYVVGSSIYGIYVGNDDVTVRLVGIHEF